MVSGLALRQASIRLGERSERALYDLRTRLIGHIHQLSLATHNDERRGGLVSRVTSDIESLAQFFQWGGLAWLLDGTLMVIVAAVMLAYNWQLALTAFVVSMPLAFVLRAVQSRLVRAYDAARHANGDMLGTIAEVVSGTPTIRAYGAGEVLEQRVHEVVRGEDRGTDQGIAARRLPVPVRGDLLGVHDLRRRRARRAGWARRTA